MRGVFTFLSLLLLVTYARAQEVCGNGIDDDGNGLVDCYDPQCAGTGSCATFFYGSATDNCMIVPSVGPFGVMKLWESTVSTSTRTIVLVADVDADGIPEVIAHDKQASQLYILNGITGAVELAIACPAINDLSNAMAVGDTDHDGFGEIYVVANDGYLYCFEHTGAQKTGFTPIFIPNAVGNDEATPGIADFNGDGVPEIYIGYNIYNSLTGVLIASPGSGSGGSNPAGFGFKAYFPVAADVLPASGLELICGNTVYAVNITAGTVAPQANSLPASLADGYTAVADMDRDGQLDVIVTSSGKVYVWNPRTGLQMGSSYTIPNNTLIGGRPNVADYDNDGRPEIGVGGRHRYVAIDFDTATFALVPLWIKAIDDPSQATTGTAFDFEGDGVTEVVYRDEDSLFVFDGATGNTKLAVQCGSGTRTEFPTIADVNGDGQADIICNCSNFPGAGGNPLGATGNVRVYSSSNGHWIASRRIMNQHSYNVTNINDDLSIPRTQQNNALVSKLNSFLCQSPVYTVAWNPVYVPLPDLHVSIDTFLTCAIQDSLKVSISVCNTGGASQAIAVPVTFYRGDPHNGGTAIVTRMFNALPIDTNGCKTQDFILPWNNTSLNLFAVINDQGINPTIAPRLLYLECDSTNNQSNRNINPAAINPVISGLDSVYCPDSINVQLTGLPAGGTFSGNGINGSIFNPAMAGNGQHTITYSYTTGSCQATTSDSVLVQTSPPVNAGPDVSFCSGDTVFLGDVTLPGYNFTWSPSTGLSSITVPAPALSLTNNTGSAQIFIYIVQATQGSCIGRDTVEISVLPPLNVSAGADRPICFIDSAVQLTGFTPTGGVWSGAGITDSLAGIFNPFIAGTGTHVLTYAAQDSASGCSGQDAISFIVFSPANLDAGNDVSVCRGEPASLLASGGNSYQWYPATGLSDSTISNPVATIDSTTTYHVIINDANGCRGEDSLTVQVLSGPVADFTIPDVCFGEDITILDMSQPSGNINHYWDMGNGATFNSNITTYSYQSPGTYTVMGIVSLGNCKDTAWSTVTVNPKPVIDFSANPISKSLDNTLPIQFLNNSSGAVQWLWNFSDGITSTESNPAHIYSDTGWYNVLLTGTSLAGCADSAIKERYIHIYSPSGIYIPNAFTPNGDGDNNEFKIYGTGIRKASCSIFNRAGEQVFESTDMATGWDGTYKSTLLPAGVYVYYATVVFDDYQVRKLIGTVTLIR